MIGFLESSAFGAALVFGFRHGFDWDHLAALTDLTGSQTSARRSMWLATLYAIGHACMVVALGLVAIVFAEQVPDGVDTAMGRLVGVSLLALGAWIVWTAVRTRGAPPLRSRWMLLVEAIQRLIARRRGDDTVVIEHAHPHDHHHEHGHGHAHLHDDAAPVAAGVAPVEVAVDHVHLHRHVAVAPRDPFVAYGSWSAYGVGLLHGIGAETPTQVLVFAAAAQATDRASSIGMLLCFVAGLVLANSLVAAASTFGFRRVLQHRAVSIGLAGVTAAFSLAVGTLLVLGKDAVLPTIWS